MRRPQVQALPGAKIASSGCPHVTLFLVVPATPEQVDFQSAVSILRDGRFSRVSHLHIRNVFHASFLHPIVAIRFFFLDIFDLLAREHVLCISYVPNACKPTLSTGKLNIADQTCWEVLQDRKLVLHGGWIPTAWELPLSIAPGPKEVNGIRPHTLYKYIDSWLSD